MLWVPSPIKIPNSLLTGERLPYNCVGSVKPNILPDAVKEPTDWSTLTPYWNPFSWLFAEPIAEPEVICIVIAPTAPPKISFGFGPPSLTSNQFIQLGLAAPLFIRPVNPSPK